MAILQLIGWLHLGPRLELACSYACRYNHCEGLVWLAVTLAVRLGFGLLGLGLGSGLVGSGVPLRVRSVRVGLRVGIRVRVGVRVGVCVGVRVGIRIYVGVRVGVHVGIRVGVCSYNQASA